MFLFTCCAMLCLAAQSWQTLCDPMDYSSDYSVHWGSPGKNTGVGCHDLLQGIFPTQGLNPGLLHCRWTLYHPSHQRSPFIALTAHNTYFTNPSTHPFIHCLNDGCLFFSPWKVSSTRRELFCVCLLLYSTAWHKGSTQ